MTINKGPVISLLCLIAGALTALSFAPYNLILFAFAGPAILFRFWQQGSPGRNFKSGYLFGLGLFGLGVNWLHISINLFGGVNLAGALVLTFLFIAFISLYPALLGYLAGRLFKTRSNILFLLLVLPALWTLGEWLRGWLFTGFPWLNLGYSQTDTALAGYAAIAGMYAVSWAVALTAAASIVILRGILRQKTVALMTAVLLWSGGWLALQQPWTEPSPRTIDYAMLQGGIPQKIKWDPRIREETLRLYADMSAPYLGHDLIIWPETAIPALYHDVEDFIAGLNAQASQHGSRYLIGIPYRDTDTRRYYNSIMLLDGGTAFYHKRHLVPFGEYLPLKPVLGELMSFLQIPMSDFSAARDNRPLLGDNTLQIGTSICYEDTFGEEIIDALPEAGILVNVSNDAWFGDSAAPHQHLQMARLRALETGRYLLRATNNGISAAIDEKGRILKQSAQFTADSIDGTARIFTGMTPYARYGNYPVVILAMLVLAGLLARRQP